MKVLFILLILLFLVNFVFAEEFSLPAKVNVNPIYNLSLNITILTKGNTPNTTINVSVDLQKTGKSGEITVDLNYQVETMKGKIVATGSADVINVTNFAEKNVTIQIPELKPGKYILNMAAIHPQAVPDSDADEFFVRKKNIATAKASVFESLFNLVQLFFMSR